MKNSILILIITLSVNISISACSCKRGQLDLPIAEFGLLSVDSRINTSFDDLIFQGNLISSQRVEVEEIRLPSKKEQRQYIELKFEIVKPFKGDNMYEGDTILIYTFGSCGFYSPINTKSIIFTSSIGLGKYVTYRGDCCRSVSEANDKTRYDQYMRFINIVKNKVDGKYEFKQPESYWDGGSINKKYNKPQIQFEISDGKFDNLWKVTLNNGIVIEEGSYRLGKRIGKWKYKRIERDFAEYYDFSTIIQIETTYKNGNPMRKKLKELRVTYDTNRTPLMIEEVRRIENTRIKIKND